MPQLIPLQTIIIHRKNEQGELVRLVPKIGQAFDFTDDEVRDIKSVAPEALREPIVESRLIATVIPDDEVPSTNTGSKKGSKSKSNKDDSAGGDAGKPIGGAEGDL